MHTSRACTLYIIITFGEILIHSRCNCAKIFTLDCQNRTWWDLAFVVVVAEASNGVSGYVSA